MTSLNNIVFDDPNTRNEPEILIELPEPKSISNNCTIIMNGHHNYGIAEEKYIGSVEEETEPFLQTESTKAPSCHKSDSTTSSNSVTSTIVSPDTFHMKESTTVASSAEEESDADVEESSIHLLQNQKEETPSIKCIKNKPKIPSFKSSPAKRSIDIHSHIQHQPLGLANNTKPCYLFKKWHCSFAHFACIGFLISILLGITCIGFGLYLAAPSDCNSNDQWWNNNVIYEIFPASFQDADGDGFGDIRGIIDRLDYIQNLSIDVIRLNSIFSALDYPLEYEHVIDYNNIDPHLGRIEDFEELVKEVHSRGMYIILDMNPTVTSDQHTWAAHWLLQTPGRYEHYYINVTDEKEDPPLESNPVYTDDEWPPPHRPFGSHFILNWSHPMVQLEMRNTMDLWLAIGVDGFYIKHIENMHVNDYDHYLKAMHQWRYILDKYSVNTTRKILMMSQDNLEFLNSAMDPVKFITVPGMVDLIDASVQLVVNGSALNVGDDVEVVRKFWSQFPVYPVISWHVGSAETLRLASIVGRSANVASFLFVSILPGSFSCFYGDEIGLENSYHLDKNKIYRGGQFTPMQWTAGLQANFTSDDSDAWIPIHPNYITRNVNTEQGRLRIFKALIELKQNGQIFPSETKVSLVHSLVTRLSSNFVDNLQYQWYHNLCGLIVVKTMKSESEYIYIGNFGSEALSFTDDEECVGGNFVFSVYPWKQVDLIISTNVALKGRIELHQLLLEPGDSVIGRLIT